MPTFFCGCRGRSGDCQAKSQEKTEDIKSESSFIPRATSRASETYPTKLHFGLLSERNDYFYAITSVKVVVFQPKSTPTSFFSKKGLPIRLLAS